jgi:hypothetical protein
VLVTISPTLGQQFGLLSEAATLFCLLMYLGGCAAAIKYRLRGAYVLSAIGGAFCICATAWSSAASLKATALCLVVLALFLLGGPVIHGFAFSLLIGFVVGTYSSVFIAAPIVLFFERAPQAKQSTAPARGQRRTAAAARRG